MSSDIQRMMKTVEFQFNSVIMNNQARGKCELISLVLAETFKMQGFEARAFKGDAFVNIDGKPYAFREENGHFHCWVVVRLETRFYLIDCSILHQNDYQVEKPFPVVQVVNSEDKTISFAQRNINFTYAVRGILVAS